MSLLFFQADKTGPEFKSLHKNTEQLIKVRDYVFHLAALSILMVYILHILLLHI